ncbi:GNAT family N-acetyltransferase [Methylocella sp.]|uniref:GNAT family N-acetyltransferase n=1 Tax=Methylocella sp. TaxID=1978226 RepID=UPI0037851A96
MTNAAAKIAAPASRADAKPASFGLRLGDGRRAEADLTDEGVVLRLDGREAARLRRTGADAFSTDRRLSGDAFPPEALLPALAAVFSHARRPPALSLLAPASDAFAAGAVARGVFESCEEQSGGLTRFWVRRGFFWQDPRMWLKGSGRPAGAEAGGERLAHPPRPPKPKGEVYRRHMPRFGADFSIRAFDARRDLDVFNAWMNLDSVAHFWGQKGSVEEHRAYIEGVAADPHMISMLGCFDDEPFAYFEIYWAKEDRIAPFYDVGDHDRGVHLLVGDSKHQGPGKVEAWFRALLHFMFLDDLRTRRIVGDPRVDHVRWIEYMQKQGFLRAREFDLPHKRSELVIIERDTFFAEPWGGPLK